MLSYHFHSFVTNNTLSFSVTLHKVTRLKIWVLIINDLREIQKK
jgi:hypothetical protein